MCYPSVLLLSVVRIERYHRLNIKDWNDLKEISPFVITIDIAQSFEFMLRMVHSRHIDMMTYLLQLNKYSVIRQSSIEYAGCWVAETTVSLTMTFQNLNMPLLL